MRRTIGLILALLLAGPVRAADLVIVIDDLGYNLARAEQAMALPVPVTLGLLPFAPNTAAITALAQLSGHEMIVHQPMEPLPMPGTLSTAPQPPDAAPADDAVPFPDGMLTLGMSAEHFDRTVARAIAAVPGSIGMNNHTGSRLTQHDASMQRLMGHLAEHGLLFLDSRTTAATVAFQAASDARIPALRRDVFLDHVPTRRAIEHAYAQALEIARRQGHAVIIAHPYDVTLRFLEQATANLPDDVAVISLRDLAERRRTRLARHEDPASPSRSPGQ